MRGTTGAEFGNSAVRLEDPRRNNLRELLIDLSRPGLCLILGAGASYGVVPMTPAQMGDVIRELAEAEGRSALLPASYRAYLQHPEVAFVADLLRKAPPGARDRAIAEFLSPGQASFLLNETFRPRGDIPSALYRIYEVFENERGVIVSYNYDRITDRQNRFPVIAPHGQRSHLLANPKTYAIAKELALELHVALNNDWWLPVPENDTISIRDEYQRAVQAWRRASAIVFIGYGFGSGADAMSFADFGENVSPGARVHVLNPARDNPDLCKQVGYVLRDRPAGFRVYGQPFAWQPFAEAVLKLLAFLRQRHVRAAIGYEVTLGQLHDGRGPKCLGA